MAGGIFITQNKIRPGFYHRFTAQPSNKRLWGEIGTAALPLELDWGAPDMVMLDADGQENDFFRAIGRGKDEVLLVREALKRAQRLLVYRVNAGGAKATLDLSPQPIQAQARYDGARGNDISVQLAEDQEWPGTYIMSTYVESVLRDEQRGLENAEELLDNDWVRFAGSGALTAAAGGQLTGGSNGMATANQYEQFLQALESWDFNSFALPKDDDALKVRFVDASKRFVETQGRLVQCIVPDCVANYEAVTSLKNGVVLQDGTVIDKAAAVAWYAGAAAAAGAAHSLTYTAYDGATEPDARLNDTQVKAALRTGHVVFVAQKNEAGTPIAVVEQDIDTLTTFSPERPQAWSKNRVVRSLYHLVNSLTRVWHLYYVGKVDNNAAGRNLFKADLASMMRALEEQGALENFDAEEDITVKKGDSSDAVVATLAVQPVDAMEKMYMTVELS